MAISRVQSSDLPVDSSVDGAKLVTYTVVDSQNLSSSVSRSIIVAPPFSNFNQVYQLASDATGPRISFNYSTITAWNYRFLVIELGSHPVIIAIWFWVNTGHTMLSLPGPVWSWLRAPDIANEVTYLPDGGFQQWYDGGASVAEWFSRRVRVLAVRTRIILSSRWSITDPQR